MMMNEKKVRKPKIVVIGGGTGLPVILKGLKAKQADVTAVVTVADDGGSSGSLRNYANVVPAGDIRNVLLSLSTLSEQYKDIFQYRFDSKDHFLAGHSIGNLIIAAMAEMQGSIFDAIQLLAEMMGVDGHVYPAAEEALILHAIFEDGSKVEGESKIAKVNKKIEKVFVTADEDNHEVKASREVLEAIHEADMVVLGPGSLFTSILPNLMIGDLGQAVVDTKAEVVYICNIMTQLGETENFTDSDHVSVLHKHLGKKFIDTVLVNTEYVPNDYVNLVKYDEYLVQVAHNFTGLSEEVPRVISDNFLLFRDEGVFHDGNKVVEELFRLAYESNRIRYAKA
ncbi:gluconeogenesis factor YvcK family protein [Carnobacterium sp.]|uniref:gluconeogenesis factor YvcK family protein n=1 Tax=Carnobacterium sp. TaxID=48221 RepID=UPI003C719BEF